MIKVLYIILFWVFFSYGVASHSDGADLYSGEVQVKNNSQSVRNKALKTILRRVLVRLSGSMDIGGNPEMIALVEKAPMLVQQFRYRIDKSNSQLESTKKRFLWASFDKTSLDKLLRTANIPIWTGNRPRVLIWLAGESLGKRSLFSAEEFQEISDVINERAEERGMPIQFPLMDLKDQTSLSAADLWLNYEPSIRKASSRYPHQVILTGRLRELPDMWQASWVLIDGSNIDNFVAKSCCRDDVILTGIDATQDLLSLRYAPTNQGETPRRVRISFKGINSVKAYVRLMDIIESQEAITFLKVKGSKLDTIYLDIWLQGGKDEFIKISKVEPLFSIIPEDEKPINLNVKPYGDNIPVISQFAPINLKLIFNAEMLEGR